MILTKAQRHRVYKEALEKLENHMGLCRVLQEVVNDLYFQVISYREMHYELPEFGRQKPYNFGVYWFPLDEYGLEQRKKVLRKCIREAAPKKRK